MNWQSLLCVLALVALQCDFIESCRGGGMQPQPQPQPPPQSQPPPQPQQQPPPPMVMRARRARGGYGGHGGYGRYGRGAARRYVAPAVKAIAAAVPQTVAATPTAPANQNAPNELQKLAQILVQNPQNPLAQQLIVAATSVAPTTSQSSLPATQQQPVSQAVTPQPTITHNSMQTSNQEATGSVLPQPSSNDDRNSKTNRQNLIDLNSLDDDILEEILLRRRQSRVPEQQLSYRQSADNLANQQQQQRYIEPHERNLRRKPKQVFAGMRREQVPLSQPPSQALDEGEDIYDEYDYLDDQNYLNNQNMNYQHKPRQQIYSATAATHTFNGRQANMYHTDY